MRKRVAPLGIVLNCRSENITEIQPNFQFKFNDTISQRTILRI